AKKVKASELVELYYQRIARLNPELDAYVLLTPELAAEQAAATEQRLASSALLGPLDGVPLSIKESASLAGYPLTNSSRAFETNLARVGSFGVSGLHAAGAGTLGQTHAPGVR